MAKLFIKSIDARAWNQCSRRVWLDNKGEVEIAPEEDAFAQLVIDRGLEHEAAVLEQISDEALGLIGKPDFLIRHESGDYQPADAKHAMSEHKKEIQVQLGADRKILINELPGVVFIGKMHRALRYFAIRICLALSESSASDAT